MDAFGSSSIPFHLVTAEAFALTKSRLNPDGVLAMNIEAVGWDSPIVKSLAATLQTQFEHVVVLPIAEPPSEIGNLILCASARPLVLPVDLPLPQGRFTAEYDRAHAWDNRFSVDETGIQIFTDELNPVDLWTESVNLRARKDLHAYFKDKGVTW
jgi:spermidine synthase